MITIKWSKNAIREFDSVLDYWEKRNKSDNYPKRNIKETDNAIKLILSANYIGIETNLKDVKMRLILNNFYLAYRYKDNTLEILKFWDCRQNPNTNPFKS